LPECLKECLSRVIGTKLVTLMVEDDDGGVFKVGIQMLVLALP
jgi:hypothetical protein